MTQNWYVAGADDNTPKGYAYNTNNGLRRYRAALSKLKAGNLTYLDIPVLGDSITEGRGTGDGIVNTSFLTKSYVGRLRTALASKYGDAGTGTIPSFFPSEGTGPKLWALSGTDWISSSYTLSGYQTNVVGATATLNFTGTGIGIVVYQGSGGSTFNAVVDAGTPTALTCSNPTLQPAKFEITGLSSGSHTLTITKTGSSAGTLYLVGAYPISGTPGVRLHMLGHGGNSSAAYASSAAGNGLQTAIDLWQAPLYIISLLANDHLQNVAPSVYQANLQTLVSRALPFGDVLLIASGLNTDIKMYKQSQYRDAMFDVAMKNNVAFIDLFNRWNADGNYAMSTLGFLQDHVHPNEAGHYDMATAVLNALVEAGA